jgi:hypothetical protein
MLAMTQVVNTTTNVFTCPSGKTTFAYVDVTSNNGSQIPITINIGNGSTFYTYWTGTTNFITVKLVLSSGDIIQVSTTGTVNVFVQGQSM